MNAVLQEAGGTLQNVKLLLPIKKGCKPVSISFLLTLLFWATSVAAADNSAERKTLNKRRQQAVCDLFFLIEDIKTRLIAQ